MTEFTIPGEPVAKARPRFARVGEHVRTFTPQKSARFEERVRLCAINSGMAMIAGPVVIEIFAYWPMRGYARRREPRPGCWKTTRPDADNVLKSVLDGLNGTAFADDGQVCSATVLKRHAAQGEGPRVVVRVGPLPEVA